MFYVPKISKGSDSTTVQSFNHFGNKKESGCITMIVELSNYREYLRGLYDLKTVGSIRVNVQYVKGSKFVTLLIDYSNKKDLNDIMNCEPIPNKIDNFKRDRFVDLVRVARDQKQVTRLWNWADHQSNSDELFFIIAAVRPECFDDPRDPNTLRFEY